MKVRLFDNRKEESEQEMPEKLSSLIIRRSPVVLAMQIVGFQILFFFLYFVLRLPSIIFDMTKEIGDVFNTAYTMLFVILALFQLYFTIVSIVSWMNDFYEIKSGEVMRKTGIFRRREQTFSLKNIEVIDLYQGFLGKMLEYGTIRLFSPFANTEFYFYHIPDPKKYIEVLREMMPKPQEQKQPSETPPSTIG